MDLDDISGFGFQNGVEETEADTNNGNNNNTNNNTSDEEDNLEEGFGFGDM